MALALDDVLPGCVAPLAGRKDQILEDPSLTGDLWVSGW